MASDASLMPLGILSLVTEPSLYSDDSEFVQTLYMHNATVEIRTNVGSAIVYVDAMSNSVVARVYGVSLRR